MTSLRMENLFVGYEDHIIVGDINLSASKGKLLALIGPNGAGKSTLLKTLTRQIPALKGQILLDDENMLTMKEEEVAKKVSAVLTGRPRTELMTCYDVVASGRYPYTGRLGILSSEDKEITMETMDLIHVTDLADRDFSRISDGQRQRVLLARALCQEPEVLILDEPTSFLDIKHKLDFLNLLREQSEKKEIAVILSLHELELARRFSDVIACIKDGKLDRVAEADEVFSDDYIDELYDMKKGSYREIYESN